MSGSDYMNIFKGFSNDLDDKNKEKILMANLHCDLSSNIKHGHIQIDMLQVRR